MDKQLILDRYRPIERLAVGGSAEVWRGHDVQLDRQVAIKRLHPHLLPDDSSRKRLAAEARAAASLSHPVIVDVYDVDADGDSASLVMELVDGESLSARIDREGPLPASAAVAVAADIADALYHAHQRGVVHRDVKPGNVLLATDGRTRLVDFGIAHSLAESAERLTLTGTVVGTMTAMAPEQLVGGPITPRTDLYGIGVVLHEALTGRPPYAAGSPVALANAQRAGPPAMDGLDPVLAGIVAACLAVEPENRPLHAGALAGALRGWLAGDPTAAVAMAPTASHQSVVDTGAVDTGAVTLDQPALVAPSETVAAPEAARPWGGRARGAMLLGAAAVLAAGMLAIVFSGLIGPAVANPSPQPSSGTSASVPPSAPAATLAATQAALPAWAAKLAEKYTEECGRPLDPALIAGMTKKQAEEALEPHIDACQEARGGGD